MKTIKIISFLLTVSMMTFVSCGNNEDNEDYRDSWIGTYVGQCSYHFSNGTDYQYDTVFPNETLSVTKNEKNGLNVDFRGMTLSAQCTAEGVLTAHSTNPHSNYYGNFKGDSLFFEYSDVSQGNSSLLSFKGRKE